MGFRRLRVKLVQTSPVLGALAILLASAAAAAHHAAPEPSPYVRRALTGHDPVLASVQRTEAFLNRSEVRGDLQTGSLPDRSLQLEFSALLILALMLGWLLIRPLMDYGRQGKAATCAAQAPPPLSGASSDVPVAGATMLDKPRSRG